MSERYGAASLTLPPVGWPPDDTEESVLGTNLHQESIRNLCSGLNELASALSAPGGARPWHAFGQTTITGWRRRDGSAYTTLPDVYVYRQPIDRRRASVSLEHDGPPLLIIEVLSRSTYRADLDEQRGKPEVYARGGVREYLALDPLGEFVREHGRGWRLEGGVSCPWWPDAQGRWQSEQLSAAIGLEGLEVAVYGPDGARQGREGEFARELARRDAEIAALRRQLEQQRKE